MKNIFLILIFILLGCQPALKVVYGVKSPKIENQTSLKKFIEKNNLDIDLEHTYYVKNVESFYGLSEVRGRGLKIPDVYLFNDNGFLIEEQLDSICFVARDIPIGEHKNYYDKVFSNPTNESGMIYHLDSLKSLLVDSQGNKLDSIGKNNRGTAIILWAKFLGKKQNIKMVETPKELLLETQLNLNIYYLNLDPQEFWEDKVSNSAGFNKY